MTTQLSLSANRIAEIMRANTDQAVFNFPDDRIDALAAEAAWQNCDITFGAVELWLSRYFKKKQKQNDS